MEEKSDVGMETTRMSYPVIIQRVGEHKIVEVFEGTGKSYIITNLKSVTSH